MFLQNNKQINCYQLFIYFLKQYLCYLSFADCAGVMRSSIFQAVRVTHVIKKAIVRMEYFVAILTVLKRLIFVAHEPADPTSHLWIFLLFQLWIQQLLDLFDIPYYLLFVTLNILFQF